MKTKSVVTILLFIFVLTSGFGCKIADQQTQNAMKPITLEYWRVWDGPDAFTEIIANYKKLHPFITINYKKLNYNEYEQALLEAWAEDRGPDIFSINNTWMKKYQKKLTPMPESISMVYPVAQGTLKKEIIPTMRTTKSLTLKELKNNFVDVVFDDVVVKEQDAKTGNDLYYIYGLPLSVDTMAMFYNKTLFNNTQIITPPAYWDNDFQQAVKKLIKQDNSGQIVQAGVSLGGSNNIERSTDILSLLMMQNGATMMDGNSVLFNMVPPTLTNQDYNPGLEALRFYSDFANPAKEVYTWNANLENSVNMFTQGRLGILLGYSYMLPQIRSQAPKLNFGIAKMPQINPSGGAQTINFANYWVEVVPKKTKYTNEAWDFIQFATKAEQARIYMNAAKRPTALKSLVAEQMDDVDLGVFAEQAITAKSWYKGVDVNSAEKAIKEMIDNAITAQDKIGDVINIGANKVQQTIYENNPVQ